MAVDELLGRPRAGLVLAHPKPARDGRSVFLSLTGGSWVVINGVIRPLMWLITILTLLITTLITPHENPSRQGAA